MHSIELHLWLIGDGFQRRIGSYILFFIQERSSYITKVILWIFWRSLQSLRNSGDMLLDVYEIFTCTCNMWHTVYIISAYRRAYACLVAWATIIQAHAYFGQRPSVKAKGMQWLFHGQVRPPLQINSIQWNVDRGFAYRTRSPWEIRVTNAALME